MQLPPEAKPVLDYIAQGEGGQDYDVLFGGHKFGSYKDHPRVMVKIPGSDKYSSAAGRYQMLSSTWDEQKKKLGLKNFSPENQDAAAWDLAQGKYQKATGRSLAEDWNQNKVDWQALAPTWTSLSKAAPAKPTPTQNHAAYPVLENPKELTDLLQLPKSSPLFPSGKLRQPAAPTLPGAGVNRMETLQALFPQTSFTPVDYNPWKQAPVLEPVNHDPFAQNKEQGT